ncbi:HET-domain-containing protein, partial [Patellaria atrata CBS 101060]
MTSYHYEPLLPPLHQVRLLELLPLREKFTLQESILKSSTCLSIVQLSSPIFCRLHVLSLHEAPSYIALSYAWCQGGGRRNITVDNVRVPVTANLDQALRHLRSQDEPIMLWADALCINQEDVVEKSEQVQRMKEIYERATEVVAWLGPGGEGSDEAMEWIRAFGSKARELRIGSTPALQLRSRRNGVSVVSSLHSLLRRPYWERAWVVQEVTVAGSISFACGTKSVPEESLHYALRLIRNYRLYFLLHGGAENKALLEINPSTAIDLLKVRRTKEISPLIYLIRRLSRFKSTDPRDKVLAFLGISEDSEDLGILSDYSKSTEHVFIQTARALICKGLYEILSMNNSYKRHGNLPSWVPDWSNP